MMRDFKKLTKHLLVETFLKGRKKRFCIEIKEKELLHRPNKEVLSPVALIKLKDIPER